MEKHHKCIIRLAGAHFASLMLSLLRFLVKCALIALVVAFLSSIGMAFLFAHPEIKTFSQIIR